MYHFSGGLVNELMKTTHVVTCMPKNNLAKNRCAWTSSQKRPPVARSL